MFLFTRSEKCGTSLEWIQSHRESCSSVSVLGRTSVLYVCFVLKQFHSSRNETCSKIFTILNAFDITQRNQGKSRLLFIQHEDTVSVALSMSVNMKHSDSLLTAKICNTVATRIVKRHKDLSDSLQRQKHFRCSSTPKSHTRKRLQQARHLSKARRTVLGFN